jgi:glyoxylase-like metal-dependent hydrolase (beta-lactamase superfamily II)/rhodanese-related sulfurtransferase
MNAEHTITIERLLEKADMGVPFLLLDVRNDDEYAAWKVEGCRPIETLHIPYFAFVEEPGLVTRVPSDRQEVLVLCAKGGSSEFVAEMLREAGINAKNVEGGMIAYGDYLQPIRVPLDPDEADCFEIWQLNRRGKGCLSYVIRCGTEAVVVDPSRHVHEYEQFVEQLGARIVWVFDTHVHADHLSGGPELARLSRASYFVAGGNGGKVQHAVTSVRDGEEIRLGDNHTRRLAIRVMKTPGHTPGSTSFLVGRRHLLTGDTLFVAGIGRPDLGGYVAEWGRVLYHTLHERLGALPDEVVILPAHYSDVSEIRDDGVVAGRLGKIRRAVPELQLCSAEEFVEAMKAAPSAPPEIYSRIIEANRGALQVDAEEASEWELGKNQCAASRH